MSHVYSDLANMFGVRLFTVTAHDLSDLVFRRCYTNHPLDYPVSGTKPLSLVDAWSVQVIINKQSFVANDVDGFSALFADHMQIVALGCGSVLNIPVLDRSGTVAGTVNALDIAGYFTPARVAKLEAIVQVQNEALLQAMANVVF